MTSPTYNNFSVRWDQEFERIKSLPRRSQDFELDVTHWFARPGGKSVLRPVQSRALYDMSQVGGLLGVIGVGHGKSITSYLAPNALSARRPLLLIPAQQREQTRRYHAQWSRDFRLYPLRDPRDPRDGCLHVMTYDVLSRESGEELLLRISPDVIIMDEVHKVKHVKAGRTRRLMRYLRQTNPGCRIVALSGTITRKSIKDFAHLAELALRHFSPVPSPWRAFNTLKEWSECLDSQAGATRHPGVLLDLCGPAERAGIVSGAIDPTTAARRAFASRLVETPGVIATEQQSVDCSLFMRALSPTVPSPLEAAIADCRRDWKIGEEEIEYATHLWQVLRQLAMGFYYRWEWPGGERDEEWLEARAAWHKEVRAFLSDYNRPGMDTPLQLARAAEAGKWKSYTWEAWKAVKDRPLPPHVAEWVSPGWLVEEVRRWVAEEPKAPCVVWYEHRAVGEALATGLGMPLCADGPRAAKLIMDCAEKRVSCVASITAHGEMKNLQAYARALVTCPPSSGAAWEQLCGRIHRQGQEADEVQFDCFAHTTELKIALVAAQRDAKFLEENTKQRQKLNYATLEGWP